MKKIEAERHNSESNFTPGTVIDFDLPERNKVSIIQNFYDSLYENIEFALIREWIANAWDAHVECGIKDRPIKVHLPTESRPEFSVTNYGCGMDLERLQVLCSYGDSTKNQSDEMTGGFGIGAKVVYGYKPLFTIRTVVDGTEYMYVGEVTEEKPMGCLKSIHSGPTDQEDQSTLSVATDSDTEVLAGIVKKYSFLTNYWDVRPECNYKDLHASKLLYSCKKYSVFIEPVTRNCSSRNSERTVLRVGAVCYGGFESRDRNQYSWGTYCPGDDSFIRFVYHANTDEFRVTQSRDSLKKEEDLEKKVYKIYEQCYQDFAGLFFKGVIKLKSPMAVATSLLRTFYRMIELENSQIDAGCLRFRTPIDIQDVDSISKVLQGKRLSVDHIASSDYLKSTLYFIVTRILFTSDIKYDFGTKHFRPFMEGVTRVHDTIRYQRRYAWDETSLAWFWEDILLNDTGKQLSKAILRTAIGFIKKGDKRSTEFFFRNTNFTTKSWHDFFPGIEDYKNLHWLSKYAGFLKVKTEGQKTKATRVLNIVTANPCNDKTLKSSRHLQKHHVDITKPYIYVSRPDLDAGNPDYSSSDKFYKMKLCKGFLRCREVMEGKKPPLVCLTDAQIEKLKPDPHMEIEQFIVRNPMTAMPESVYLEWYRDTVTKNHDSEDFWIKRLTPGLKPEGVVDVLTEFLDAYANTCEEKKKRFDEGKKTLNSDLASSLAYDLLRVIGRSPMAINDMKEVERVFPLFFNFLSSKDTELREYSVVYVAGVRQANSKQSK